MFGQLALVVAAGLAGPLLAGGRRQLAPVVVGELAAGAFLGRTGFRLIDPTGSAFPTFYALGFVMLMLTAGTHVDLRSPEFRGGVKRAALAVALVFAGSLPAGWLVSHALSVQPFALFAVLVAGSSAAVAFPIIEERNLRGPGISLLIAWIALADSFTVVLLPLTLVGTGKVAGALLGDALIIAAGVATYLLAARVGHARRTKETWDRSRERGWALQLRLSVILVLILATLAERTGASTLVAGFAAGMILVRLGEPGRLEVQISGVANGFFVPAFFVLLGATLDLRALVTDPRAMLLAAVLALAAVGVHVGAALLAGKSERVPTGMAASAQLGLPAAAASLGLASHALSPAIAAAIVAAGCLTLVPASIGGALLAGAPRPRARKA